MVHETLRLCEDVGAATAGPPSPFRFSGSALREPQGGPSMVEEPVFGFSVPRIPLCVLCALPM